MSLTIRIVYLEDDESAFALVQALLASEGVPADLVRVEDEAGYRAALQPPPDLILSDYNLPAMDGAAALALRRQLCPSVPFILVSGAVGEARAIEILREGVTDFILKDQLNRLAPAIERALREAEEHRQWLTMQRALRESEDRFRRLMDNAPDVIFRYRFEPTPGYDYISPAVERLCGYSPEEFYADPLLAGKLTHPDDQAKIRQIERDRQVPQGNHEVRWVARDGRPIITEQRFAEIRDDHGRLIAIEGIARDITQARAAQEHRRALELQLQQAQRMETIGVLAGGIAHDFNNILTGILGFAELGRGAIHEPRVVGDYLEEIRGAGLRAKDLVAQILTFSRQNQAQMAPLDLGRAVGEVLKFLRASTPATIRLERHLEAGTIRADATQVHQLVLNLATNAVHAMRLQGTGTLSVTVRPVDVDAELAARVAGLEPGRYLRLTVADTGHGMDATTVERIFDPFFTTKPAGEGTGLGLAVVLGIVRTHAGGISVESKPGAGTTFAVYLPECSSAAPRAESAPPVPPGRGERILLVDDEVSISRFAAARLHQLGFRVTVCNDPAAALATVRAAPRPFDAVISDFAMPGMNGQDLVLRIRALHPDTPAVMVTGNRNHAAPAAKLPASIMVDKPFIGDDLARALHTVLAGRPAPATRAVPPAP